MAGHHQQQNLRKRNSHRKHGNSSHRSTQNNAMKQKDCNSVRLFPLFWPAILGLFLICVLSFYFTRQSPNKTTGQANEGQQIEVKRTKSPPKQVLVYKNGDRHGGVVVMLNQEICGRSGGQDLGYTLAQYLYRGESNPCILPSDEEEEASDLGRTSMLVKKNANAVCRAFDHVGRRVRDCEAAASLVPSSRGRVLYIVPPGREFLWPTVEIGHKEVISHIIPPTGSPIVMETLSHEPRLFKLHGFFSDQEADSIVAHVQDGSGNPYTLVRSTVNIQGVVDQKRTSDSGFDISSKAAIDLKHRAFKLLGIEKYDETWADGLQVLRYNKSTAYNKHFDYVEQGFDPNHNFDSANGGTNRFATILIYLSDVEEGGETYFSETFGEKDPPTPTEIQGVWQYVRDNQQRWEISQDSWEETMVLHCQTKLSVKPRKGDAILFYSQLANGTLDSMSMHGGCPVLSGDKWAANLWVWNGPRLGYTTTENNRDLAKKVRKETYQIEQNWPN
mmetsp:Transcript_1215/g.1560  ORF Transcript_1215/g.1560 Transcript_1215/m.1560 type:complete len:502 (+) Transcript_1215:119-1624(+)